MYYVSIPRCDYYYSIDRVELRNPNLENMSSDFLYHLDINVLNTKNTSDIQKKFGDVRVRRVLLLRVFMIIIRFHNHFIRLYAREARPRE